MDRSISTSTQTTPPWPGEARRRAYFYLLAAFLLAIIAGFLTFNYLQDLRKAAVPSGQALVARRDIQPGTVISNDHVELREVPETVLPDGYLTVASQAVDRVALVPIIAGEVILAGKLSGGPTDGLSARLPDGRWALTLPKDWLVNPLPDLVSGDRIEIMAYQAGSPVEQVGIIVSGIEVLQFPGSGEGLEHLTLSVTIEEATAILYARGNGFILMILLRPYGG
jgi:pilus assembly protein CpaB